MQRCENCGSDMVPGFISKGWCKAECDLVAKEYTATFNVHNSPRPLSQQTNPNHWKDLSLQDYRKFWVSPLKGRSTPLMTDVEEFYDKAFKRMGKSPAYWEAELLEYMGVLCMCEMTGVRDVTVDSRTQSVTVSIRMAPGKFSNKSFAEFVDAFKEVFKATVGYECDYVFTPSIH